MNHSNLICDEQVGDYNLQTHSSGGHLIIKSHIINRDILKVYDII